MNITPTIYKINKNNRNLSTLNSSEEIINKILITFDKNFNFENLNNFEIEEIKYYLFTFNTNEFESEWKNFLPQILRTNKNFFQNKLSLILFIETEFDIFCIIGGNSFKVINPFIDHSYGLEFYSKIINPTQDVISSIKSRGITGNLAGMSQQYRDEFRIIDYIKFGKVPKEIHIKLNAKTSRLHFKYLLDNKYIQVLISVGKGLKIKKSINFNQLHKIIKELIIINSLESNDYLSSYEEIKDLSYIQGDLKETLIDNIYKDIQNINRLDNNDYAKFEFDFCNPNNIEQFYEADYYILKEKTESGGHKQFEKIFDRDSIYRTVIKRAINVVNDYNKFKIKVFLQGVRIACYKNDKLTISSSFLFHFNTEFRIYEKPIFLIDNKWYHLRDTFIKELKTQTIYVLKTYKLEEDILTFSWNKNIIRTEKEYNLQYNNLNNYIVIDTIIIDGVELCDILYYDETTIYLIHNKYGFTSSTRELTNQILISAKRLRESLGNENPIFLKKIYNSLLEKGRNVNELNEEEFINLFKNKKIKFVLAFTSNLTEDLIVEENIDRYISNIAKFSVVECSSEMKINYYDIYFKQIPRI